jgi:hypothetical protein
MTGARFKALFLEAADRVRLEYSMSAILQFYKDLKGVGQVS